MTRPIYLDHHATTPCDPEVVQAMLPWFTERFGNPASTTHIYGREAQRAVEDARAEVAALVGADPRAVVFTSGATEALNLALKGLAGATSGAATGRPLRVAASAFEHKAVLDTLARPMFEATAIPVSRDGFVTVDAARAALAAAPRPIDVVCVMAAQNEVGTVQPLAALTALAHEHGALMLSDAVQLAGKLPLDARALDVDLLAISAHKLYGPKGIGALVVARRRTTGARPQAPLELAAQIDGGGHERRLRSGTLNVPAIVGFGVAARLARARMDADAARIGALRDRLWAALQAGLGDRVALTGTLAARLPNNLHIAFPGVEARRLLDAVPELALSAGSACTSGISGGSHVLRAMGLSDRHILGSIRIGLGRGTTEAEVDTAARLLVAAARSL